MFGRKRAKQSSESQGGAAQSQPAAPPQSQNGYQVIEVPTFHGRQRKVTVYRSDGSGRIIKSFKK